MIPLKTGTKQPALADWSYDTAGRWDSSVDEWLARGERVGVLMGGELVGLDSDIKQVWQDDGSGTQVMTRLHGDDEIGRLLTVAGLAELPRTLTIRTQNGGTHRYFRQHSTARVSQTSFPALDIRAHRNAYLALGDGYEVIDDAGGIIAELPETFAIAIMTLMQGPRESSGQLEQYGSAQTHFNNALTSVKGMLVRLGWDENQANEAVRKLNEVSDDPMDLARLESTVLRPKDWAPGDVVDDDMYRWAERISAEPGILTGVEAERYFATLARTDADFARLAVRTAFLKWLNDKLRQQPINRDSWDEVDLSPLLGAGAASPIRPDMLLTVEGSPLAYHSSLHWIWGEPGHGKTMLCTLWAASEILRERHIVWIDLEAQAADTMQKLLTICQLRPAQIMKFFHLIQPEGAFNAETCDIVMGYQRYKPSLLVIDAANDLIQMGGGKHNDVESIASIDQMLLKSLKLAGTAIAVIDHVAKSQETRTWPINSGHKKAISDCGLHVQKVAPFTHEQAGYAKITSQKDRHGAWPDGTDIGYIIVQGGRAALTRTIPLSLQSAAAAAAVSQGALTGDDSVSTRSRVLHAHADRQPGESNWALANRIAPDLGVTVRTVLRHLPD